jgi:3-hydroxymyristoyl/3-hydroxydecanoyl-(acyl carrier protein) dehydratase
MTGAAEYSAILPVDPEHPVFAGHFPGRPIVPGVLLIDWALAAIQDVVPEAMSIAELGTVKFLQPVRPGAELLLLFSIADNAGSAPAAKKITLRIECEGQLVASATLTAAVIDQRGSSGQ